MGEGIENRVVVGGQSGLLEGGRVEAVGNGGGN